MPDPEGGPVRAHGFARAAAAAAVSAALWLGGPALQAQAPASSNVAAPVVEAPPASSDAAAATRVVLKGGPVTVELAPSPGRLTFYFRDSAGQPLPGSSLNASALLRPGEKTWRVAVPPPRDGLPAGRADFLLPPGEKAPMMPVLRFEHGGEHYVVRFPPVSQFPPFVLEQGPHDAEPHGHVTPHDGSVFVFGDEHVEVAVEGWRIRLFRYDVAMNPLPASDLSAAVFLDPCGASAELHPPRAPSGAPFLEAPAPSECATAKLLTLHVSRAGLSRSYRVDLTPNLGEALAAAPIVLARGESEGIAVEMRAPGPPWYPRPVELELRFFHPETLAPIDLRSVPRVLLRRGNHPRTVRLPSPARLPAPGRWRFTTYLPPSRDGALDVAFEDLADRTHHVALEMRVEGFARRPAVDWFAGTIAAILVLACVARRAARRAAGTGMSRALGVVVLLRSRLYPGVLQWPVLILLGAVAYRLFQGPADAHRNAGAVLLFGLMAPALWLCGFVTARGWCAACPVAAVADPLRDLFGRGRPWPAGLTRRGPAIAAAQVVILGALFLGSGAGGSARIVGLILGGYFAAALALSVGFERRLFCAALCPLGAGQGAFSTVSPFGLSIRRGICERECRSPECDRGSAHAGPCPTRACPDGKFVDSTLCALCGHCVKSCPHDAVSAEPRLPSGAREALAAGSPAPSIVVSSLIGCAAVVLLSRHPVWARVVSLEQGFGPCFSAGISAFLIVLIATAAAGIGRLTGGSNRGIANTRSTGGNEPGRNEWDAASPHGPVENRSQLVWLGALIGCWAVPTVLASAGLLPRLTAALISGADVEAPLHPGTRPTVTLAIQLAIVCATLFGQAACLTNPRPGRLRSGGLSRVAGTAAGFLAVAVLILVLASSFDLVRPLGQVFRL